MADKYTATWVSHSSIGDFLRCTRLYYLKNVYKDPTTGRKMNVVSPALSVGLAVHDTLESLLTIPATERFKKPLKDILAQKWQPVSGKAGGFTSKEAEEAAYAKAEAMIERVERAPGPLANKTIRMNQELPYYFVSPDENIILCGKVDWLEYVPEDDSVHVIDFKTGSKDEREDSLQLPIYALLLKNCQKRRVHRASYWYLQRSDVPQEVALPDLEEAYERVITLARQIKQIRSERAYMCGKGAAGCYACRPFESVLRGEAEHVGVGGYNQDLYLISQNV